MVRAGEPVPAVGTNDAFLAVEGINDLGGVFMCARNQHVFTPQGEQTTRAFSQFEFLFAVFLHKPARFYAVWRDDGGLRNQEFAQR